MKQTTWKLPVILIVAFAALGFLYEFGAGDSLILMCDRVRYDLFEAARNPWNFEDESFVVVAIREISAGHSICNSDVETRQLPYDAEDDAIGHRGLRPAPRTEHP